MENKLSRVEIKKQKREEKKQKRKIGGLTTLRALGDLSRAVELIERGWNFCKEYFNDFFL